MPDTVKERLLPVAAAVHIVAITVGSLPLLVDERALTPEAWADPLAQTEFVRWSERLGQWGISRTPQQVGQIMWRLAGGILKFQRALQRPFEPYYREAGTRQRWRMFPAAVEEPICFRIDVRTSGRWRTVYRMGDSECSWLRRYFDRDRFRAAINLYGWGLYPGSYRQFADWITEEAKRDFPESEAIRVGFEQVPALRPGDRVRERSVTELRSVSREL